MGTTLGTSRGLTWNAAFLLTRTEYNLSSARMYWCLSKHLFSRSERLAKTKCLFSSFSKETYSIRRGTWKHQSSYPDGGSCSVVTSSRSNGFRGRARNNQPRLESQSSLWCCSSPSQASGLARSNQTDVRLLIWCCFPINSSGSSGALMREVLLARILKLPMTDAVGSRRQSQQHENQHDNFTKSRGSWLSSNFSFYFRHKYSAPRGTSIYIRPSFSLKSEQTGWPSHFVIGRVGSFSRCLLVSTRAYTTESFKGTSGAVPFQLSIVAMAHWRGKGFSYMSQEST